MSEPMTKQDAIEYLLYMKHDVQVESPMDIAIDTAIEALKQSTIEPEVRHGNGCSYCKGRAYSKKPVTVITRNMKRVEVVFEYCPACGKKMNGGADNG